MIHGAGGRSGAWQNLVNLLDAAINVLALDLPGHGETKGEGYTSIAEYSHWLSNILKSLFDHPILLMGHSMGGAIVQETAIFHPEHFKGIILAATGPRLKVNPMFLDGLTDNFEQTVNTLTGYAYGPGVERSIIEEGKKIMKHAGSTVVHNDFLACNRFDRQEGLAQIDLPCLILCGSEDKLTPPKLSKALNQGINGSTLKILQGAGHMIMIERHRELDKAVQDFILGLPMTS
ncbi:MAG: alpha/beta hydrolase [Desulfatiglandales bacterium]|nr:alpha/beta hydrolase [Desulfatiglandales bacterium]